jgi:hypothetical protein
LASEGPGTHVKLTVVVDLNAQALDRLQLPPPVHVVLAGVGANSLGQTVQTRQLLLPDLFGVCGRQPTQRPPERPLRVGGPVKTQFSADPSVRLALAPQPQDLVINRFGRLRHAVTSSNPPAQPLTRQGQIPTAPARLLAA